MGGRAHRRDHEVDRGALPSGSEIRIYESSPTPRTPDEIYMANNAIGHGHSTEVVQTAQGAHRCHERAVTCW